MISIPDCCAVSLGMANLIEWLLLEFQGDNWDNKNAMNTK